MKEYDVIIAGASFAGLAVASRITRGKVLLIDRKEIGAYQVSTCGTTVGVVRASERYSKATVRLSWRLTLQKRLQRRWASSTPAT